MASWLARSTLERALRVRALAGTLVPVAHRPFTVVKGLFTSGNLQIVCDRRFPRQIYRGVFPWIRQKE